MIPVNKGKSEYAVLKLMGQGRFECTLVCTSRGVTNSGLISNKYFTKNLTNICGDAAKYLCKVYTKV